eukprot:TRINITY_DN9269_c0_g1_i1.p1 TRINITY_DN9269_c0_g1~~TRINITY_DN9269_c0_g1_i1.p1  ORF type:complete len:496 (-),score=114.68 TRINITY_DN9269_c0_g1_i1:40-1527(-)
MSSQLEGKKGLFIRKVSVKDKHLVRSGCNSPEVGSLPSPMLSPKSSSDTIPAPEAKERENEEVVFKAIKPHIREKILREVLDTEMDYVNDLAILISIYKEPLEKLGIISGIQTETLFSNVNSLYEINKDHVLAPMNAKFQENIKETWKLSLGEIFLSLQDHLKAYTDYCSNQPLALAMLKSLETEKPEFAQFLDKTMMENPIARNLSLLSFLIKPVQRLCKYPLLLRELINNTNPQDSEYTQLVAASELVKNAVTFVNEKQREAEENLARRMKKIEDLSTVYAGIAELKLASDVNRELNREGKLDIVLKKTKHETRQILLFSDLLLTCIVKKRGKGISYKLENATQISDIIVTDLADEESTHGKNGFIIKDKKNDVSYTFTAETQDEKTEWIADLKRLIKDHQRQLAKQLKRTQVTTNVSLTTSQLQAVQKTPEEEIAMLDAKLVMTDKILKVLGCIKYEPLELREAIWRDFIEKELCAIQAREKDLAEREASAM